MAGLVRSVLAGGLFLILWQALVTIADLPPYILPGPGRVAEALWQNRALIAWHAGITALEVVVGLALGAVLGAATAIGLAVSPVARYLIRPVLVATQALPSNSSGLRLGPHFRPIGLEIPRIYSTCAPSGWRVRSPIHNICADVSYQEPVVESTRVIASS